MMLRIMRAITGRTTMEILSNILVFLVSLAIICWAIYCLVIIPIIEINSSKRKDKDGY
jgi:hypothetical protein